MAKVSAWHSVKQSGSSQQHQLQYRKQHRKGEPPRGHRWEASLRGVRPAVVAAAARRIGGAALAIRTNLRGP